MKVSHAFAAVAIAAAGLIPAAAGAAASNPAPPPPAAATAEATTVTPSGTWPDTWVPLADYTDTIAVAVPTSWGQMEIMPALNDDGSPRPWLAATPDMSAFLPAEGEPDTFTVPGMVFMAYPGIVDTAATVAGSEYHDVCDAQPVATFTRGLMQGHLQEFTGCGDDTAARIVFVAATIDGNPDTYLLLVQLTGAPNDDAVLDGLLSSFSPIDVPG